MSRRWLAAGLILALAAPPAWAEPDPLGFARAIAAEDPHLALEEIDKFLYFQPADPRAAAARAERAEVLVLLRRHSEAERQLAAIEAEAAPTARWRWQLRRAEVQALAGAPGRALQTLLPLTRSPASAPSAWRRVLWVALGARWWGQALEATARLEGLAPGSAARLGPMRQSLAAHLAEAAPSPESARLLSTLWPGSGQIYAGAWEDGLASMAINAGIVALLAGAWRSGDWVGGGLVVALGSRYYMGGIENAGARAEAAAERLEAAVAARWLAEHEAWLLEGAPGYN